MTALNENCGVAGPGSGILVSAGRGNLKSNYICEDIPQSLMGFGDGERFLSRQLFTN